MTDHDIHTLLDIASAPHDAVGLTGSAHPGAAEVFDVARADLRRARTVRTRRRARYAAVSATGLAVIGVGGLGLIGLPGGTPGGATDSHGASPDVQNSVNHRRPVIRLVAKHLDADPYTFATTPAGWAVQGSTAYAVTVAPVDGSVSDNPTDFTGKLVIMLVHGNQAGVPLSYDGRDFVKRGDSGYTTLATRTRPGEPQGSVLVQFPDDAGWTTDTMLKFLSTVHVNSSARAARG